MCKFQSEQEYCIELMFLIVRLSLFNDKLFGFKGFYIRNICFTILQNSFTNSMQAYIDLLFKIT